MTPVKDIRVGVVLKITIDTKSLHLLIKGGVKALGATANLAKSAIKTLDPDFYSAVTKPIDFGIEKFKTPGSFGQAWDEWKRANLPGSEQTKFLKFLEEKGFMPDADKDKGRVSGTQENGIIYVVEVDYDENNKPTPLRDDNGNVVKFKYPLHFKKEKGEYIMTKSPSATGRRTYNSSTTPAGPAATSTAPQPSTRPTVAPQNILRQYYKFVRKRGLGIYDPIESNVFGSFLVKKIGLSHNATRKLITKVTRKPFAKDRKLKPQQVAKIAQILSQRGKI